MTIPMTVKIKKIEKALELPRLSRADTHGERSVVTTMERRVGEERAGVTMKIPRAPPIVTMRHASFSRSRLN
jgi:hypothetical protein